MAERKRSRLKLKAKKTNSDASISGSKRPNKEPITNQISVKQINTTSISNVDSDKQNIDVIHIIDDDDDDDISVRARPAADIQERPKIDRRLLDLQQKLSKFRSPVCDVWELDDLPPYIEKTKRTSKCHTCTEELLPLPKFSRNYLTSKRSDYSFTVDFSERSNYDIDIPVPKEQGNMYKRRTSDDLESDSKRKKLVDDGFNIGVMKEVRKEKVHNKPATSDDLSCIPNNAKSCPICTVTFSSSVNQMEIDSHIASCLSLADDDIDW